MVITRLAGGNGGGTLRRRDRRIRRGIAARRLEIAVALPSAAAMAFAFGAVTRTCRGFAFGCRRHRSTLAILITMAASMFMARPALFGATAGAPDLDQFGWRRLGCGSSFHDGNNGVGRSGVGRSRNGLRHVAG